VQTYTLFLCDVKVRFPVVQIYPSWISSEALAFTAFERLFKERGLPGSICSDNGVPFASPNSLFNLSKLSVWWLCLGITIERIQPGQPQQNGRHERMHLTLKTETTRPAGLNSLQQQTKFDGFLEEFNNERRQLYGLRSRVHRSGGKNSAATKQPFLALRTQVCSSYGELWVTGWPPRDRNIVPRVKGLINWVFCHCA
jgi:transposase InsO family protein